MLMNVIISRPVLLQPVTVNPGIINKQRHLLRLLPTLQWSIMSIRSMMSPVDLRPIHILAVTVPWPNWILYITHRETQSPVIVCSTSKWSYIHMSNFWCILLHHFIKDQSFSHVTSCVLPQGLVHVQEGPNSTQDSVLSTDNLQGCTS